MKKLILLNTILFLIFSNGFSQTLIDTYSDGNFSSAPSWNGDASSWKIVTNSSTAAGASNSNTLQLDVSSGSGTQYLSTQISSWEDIQEWGFFFGRRSQALSGSNSATIWLYANEVNLESSTVDGYAITIGDNSGGDEFNLVRMTNGSPTNTIVSSADITNGRKDFGVLIRVTRSATGNWEFFTSTLPASNGSGSVAADLPDATNANVSQGTGMDNTHTISANGSLGFVCVHSSGGNGRTGQEFDQIYLSTSSGCTSPTTQAMSFGTANITDNSMDVTWTRGDGDGGVVVLARAGSAVDEDLINATTYNANMVFGSGDEVGTDNFVVYNGTGTSVNVTGLSANSTYHYAIYEYNSAGTCYNITELTGDAITTCSTPSDVTGANAAAGNVQVSISWTDATCFDEVLVVASSASVTGMPTSADGSHYTADAAYASGTASQDFTAPEYPVFKGTGSSVTVTSLTNGTSYFFKVFTRKGNIWSTGVEVNVFLITTNVFDLLLYFLQK